MQDRAPHRTATADAPPAPLSCVRRPSGREKGTPRAQALVIAPLASGRRPDGCPGHRPGNRRGPAAAVGGHRRRRGLARRVHHGLRAGLRHPRPLARARRDLPGAEREPQRPPARTPRRRRRRHGVGEHRPGRHR
ncbi:hypothetical protein SCOCK_80094 [Actinacidiphila cocklensis]|uniref:Uncharacterized protein n=1 Tax=Actinacidiphila cocklensis TaxID=887465 RepID=A0A9W4GV70_9ACTN|nr:hypothetical protein SCOCK_80094 [Actinacidiphila cocklensis]